jgi:5-carboxymethyl-2-hydroxymuconate isomerase
MPHLIVEYSANLEAQVDIRKLINEVHQAAVRTGIFEVAAIRTRGQRRDHYVIADGDKENTFLSVWARIAPGRDPETRKRIGKEVFDSVCKYLEPIFATTPIGITVEVQEIDNTAAFRKNTLRSKEQSAKAPA